MTLAGLSIFELLLANVFLVAGSALQGVAGYGIGTLATPLLFLISPTLIPGSMMLNAVVLTVLLLLRNRAGVRVREVRFTIAGSVVGTVLGALCLTVITGEQFDLAFGILILLGVFLSVVGIRPKLSLRNSVLAGSASGFMGTMIAVGGPPIALIYQNEKGPLVRANMSAFFLFSSCIGLVALYATGHLGALELKLFALTIPGVICGFLLSALLVRRLPFEAMRPIILSIAAFAGVGAIIRGIH